jgi:hypothetical protein
MDERSVLFRGQNFDLTSREFELAAFLFSNPGRVISRELLAKVVRGRGRQVASKTIGTCTCRILRKLPLNPENGLCLTSMYTCRHRLDEVIAGVRVQVRVDELLPLLASSGNSTQLARCQSLFYPKAGTSLHADKSAPVLVVLLALIFRRPARPQGSKEEI